MEHLKLIFLLIILLSHKILTAKKEDYTFGTRYTNIECRTDNSSIVLRYCYLKPYSRRIVAANIGVSFIKPLKSLFYVEIIYSYRYGTIYR